MLKVKMRKEVMMRTTRKTAVRMMNRRPVVKLMRHSELRCKLLLVQLWLAWTKRLVLRGKAQRGWYWEPKHILIWGCGQLWPFLPLKYQEWIAYKKSRQSCLNSVRCLASIVLYLPAPCIDRINSYKQKLNLRARPSKNVIHEIATEEPLSSPDGIGKSCKKLHVLCLWPDSCREMLRNKRLHNVGAIDDKGVERIQHQNIFSWQDPSGC